jgi:serine/threonine-protein kinase
VPDGPGAPAGASGPLIEAFELAKAKRHLAAILGPIAGRLVDKAAARARSASELYSILALNIDDPAERSKFLALAPAQAAVQTPPPSAPEPAEAPSIVAAEIEAMTRLMANYIGPIAAIVVKRESRASANLEHLRQKLADHIRDEGQRAEFLRDVQAR